MYKVESIPPPDGDDPHEKITKVGDLALAVNEALLAAKLDVAIGRMPTRRLAKFEPPSASTDESLPAFVDDTPVEPAGVPRWSLGRIVAFGADLLVVVALAAAAAAALLAH